MCHRETAWESLRLQKRETLTVCFVLVWVYFERERFESGFCDLTLCVKVLRVVARKFHCKSGLSSVSAIVFGDATMVFSTLPLLVPSSDLFACRISLWRKH